MIFMFLFKFSESGGADNSRTSKDKQDSANNDNIGLLGVGSGIEEVALPISFKIANIEATAVAKQRTRNDRIGDIVVSSLNNAGYRYDRAFDATAATTGTVMRYLMRFM
jgi:hypothetical protein